MVCVALRIPSEVYPQALGHRLLGVAPCGSLTAWQGQASEGVAMWRVIVRLTYRSDHNSRLRRHVADLFGAMGMQNTDTGLWESPAVSADVAAAQMGQILSALADPQGTVTGVGPHTALRHLWVYIDRT
jgi:hypothetical protein